MSQNYVLGVETSENVFLYIHESPYLKNRVDSKNQSKCVNIFAEIDLDKAINDLNKAALKWTFNATQMSDLGPFFDVHVEHKDNQSPECVFYYKLKKTHTPVDVMKYILNNSINVECSIGMTLFILYCVWKYLGDERFNKLHPIFVIKSTSINMNPLIQLLFRTKNCGHMKPCDIDEQKKELQNLQVGSYCYVRGSIGWYNFIASRGRYNSKTIELKHQGENLLYLGNQKFMSFLRRDSFDKNYKGDSVSFVTDEFDKILDNLMVNGKKTLLESVDNHRHLYRRYLVYYLDKEDASDNNKINQYINKVFEEGREMDDPKLDIIYNPFDVVGVNGFSDMYLNLEVIDNLDKVIEEQFHYKSLVEGVLKGYRKGMYSILDSNALIVALDNFEREFPMFGLIDCQRHKYFSLCGWGDNIPLLKNSELVNFPVQLINIKDEPKNLSNVEFYEWELNPIKDK
jgi:hypothetical protein